MDNLKLNPEELLFINGKLTKSVDDADFTKVLPAACAVVQTQDKAVF